LYFVQYQAGVFNRFIANDKKLSVSLCVFVRPSPKSLTLYVIDAGPVTDDTTLQLHIRPQHSKGTAEVVRNADIPCIFHGRWYGESEIAGRAHVDSDRLRTAERHLEEPSLPGGMSRAPHAVLALQEDGTSAGT
jgi:hypothetical protein